MKKLFIIIISCLCIHVSYAQEDIASLEYFFNEDPGIGLATSIDIDPDAEIINQNFNISTSGLTEGVHRLFIRAVKTNGTLSLYANKTFRVAPPVETNTNDIVEAEYFYNQDPGIGLATPIDVTDTNALDEVLTASTASLPIGVHRLFVRVKNSNDKWSLYDHKTFRVAPTVENNTYDIVEAEYFYNQDPGIGLATPIDVTDTDALDDVLTASTASLPVGVHRLFVRVKNSNNAWSLYEHKAFRVAPPVENNTHDIVEAEYFYNQDPGIGLATAIDVTDTGVLDDVLTASTASLPVGVHRLFVRVKNSNNKWSLYEHKTFRVAPIIEINTASIVAAEYYIDIDPGFGSATAITVTGDAIDEDFLAATTGSMAQGDHYLYVRTLNADGTWSLYERQYFEVNGTLDVNSVALSEIKIYPIPASDYVNIQIPKHLQIESVRLVDMNGRVVTQLQGSIEKIDVSNLQHGVYLLQINTGSGSLSKRIIKK